MRIEVRRAYRSMKHGSFCVLRDRVMGRIKLKPLNKQTIVILGASSGMGLATARLAAAAGAQVFLGSRDAEVLERVCAEINAKGGTADFVALDVASETSVNDFADAAVKRFGGFDTWVNVAGVCLVGPFKDILMADHRRVFEVNYWGLVYGSLAAVRHFRQEGKAGVLTNVGSATSEIPLPYAGAYSASKFAVKAFTNVLRMELSQEKLPVSVTFIKPGAVDTPFLDNARTTLGNATRMMPPRYMPSVAARAILNAAEHSRREITIGFPTLFGGKFASMFPRLVEGALSRATPESVVDKERAAPYPDSLYAVPEGGRERSGHLSARSLSMTTLVQTHPMISWLLLLGTIAVIAVFVVAF
jgi:short-subunit dehydrogenase